MKKNIIILILFVVSIFPINIFAYELSCDEGSYTFGKSFTCRVKGDIAEYDELSGNLEFDEVLTCGITNINENLTNTSKDNKSISLTGRPSSEELFRISCRVNSKLENEKNVTLVIPEFKYHIKNSGMDVANEILRSDYIKIGPYISDDGKPRNVSNPDVRIKKLSSKGLDLTFSQFITEYKMEVLYDLEEINFEYELVNKESTIEISGNNKLSVGDNIFDLYVTSMDGLNKACYTIVITRLPRGENIYYKEKDSSLSSLTIEGHQIKFESIITDYNIHVDRDTEELFIKASPTVKNATYKIENNTNIKNGSVATVTVTSQDETTKTVYRINITKEAQKKDYTTFIIVAIFIISIISVIVLIIKTSSSKKSDMEVIKDIINNTTIKKKENKNDTTEVNTIQESNNIQTTPNKLDLNTANVVTPTPVENNITNQEINNNQVVVEQNNNTQ